MWFSDPDALSICAWLPSTAVAFVAIGWAVLDLCNKHVRRGQNVELDVD
jgi:hypothetical protein